MNMYVQHSYVRSPLASVQTLRVKRGLRIETEIEKSAPLNTFRAATDISLASLTKPTCSSSTPLHKTRGGIHLANG